MPYLVSCYYVGKFKHKDDVAETKLFWNRLNAMNYVVNTIISHNRELKKNTDEAFVLKKELIESILENLEEYDKYTTIGEYMYTLEHIIYEDEDMLGRR